MLKRSLFGMLLATTSFATASAGEFQLALGASGAKTDWPSDGAGYGSLKLGYRFRDLMGPYFLGRLGYAPVDNRMLTFLSLGVQVWGRLWRLRPYARVGVVHQHEESGAALSNEPVGAVLGVGDGIRHRTGIDGGLGVDLPFFTRRKVELVLSVEANTSWMTYSSGPSWYWGGGLAIGMNYQVGSLGPVASR